MIEILKSPGAVPEPYFGGSRYLQNPASLLNEGKNLVLYLKTVLAAQSAWNYACLCCANVLNKTRNSVKVFRITFQMTF